MDVPARAAGNRMVSRGPNSWATPLGVTMRADTRSRGARTTLAVPPRGEVPHDRVGHRGNRHREQCADDAEQVRAGHDPDDDEGRRRSRDPLRDPVDERPEHDGEQDRDRDGRDDHGQPTDRLPEQPATTGDEEQTRGPRRRQQERVREALAGDRRCCHVLRIGADERFLRDIERLRTGQVWAESRPRTGPTPRRSTDAR
ncbi:hypothetical protein ACQREA_16610 [Dietzia cinnamea]|uniref:hypothetical protein n=1 Tax=Dietzia cinnamea TaxID=321318 RepID=UPI003D0123DF